MRSTRKVAAFARRDPVLGRRHRRHALRPLSRPRRAARHLRQARGLRRHPATDAGDADRLAAHPVGQGAIRSALKQAASRFGLGFDAMNSNTFSDAAGPEAVLQVRLAQPQPMPATRAPGGRAQPRMHRDRPDARLEGADGLDRRRLEFSRPESISPGPSSAISTSMREIYAALPDDWRLFTEHKMYEPAFYSTVVQDWGTNYLIARSSGPKAYLPGRPRPPRAERQHRDDRRAADPVRQTRRLPLQRFEIWRRRPRCRLDRSVPAVPRLQRAGRCRASAAPRASIRPTCSTRATTSPIRSRA